MTINTKQVLQSLNIDPTLSVHRAINEVTTLLDASSDRLSAANMIITSFGGDKVRDVTRGEIIAKALVEQAFTGAPYNAEKAIVIAKAKAARYAQANTPVTAVKTRASRKSNDKKAQARSIFLSNKDKLSRISVIKLIAKTLNITEANARYYTDRVFSKEM